MAAISDTLRDLSFQALVQAHTLAGKNVYSPGDWPTTEDNMPALLVNCNNESGESGSKAQANFTVTSIVEVEAKCLSNTAEEARKTLAQLCEQVKDAIFTNHDIMQQLQQFPYFKITRQYDSQSGKHIGHAKIEIGMEYFEVPETPVCPQPLTTLGLNVDLANRFDPTGTYPNPPFPDSVQAAPRTSGPDGRNEGGGIITLPQD